MYTVINNSTLTFQITQHPACILHPLLLRTDHARCLRQTHYKADGYVLESRVHATQLRVMGENKVGRQHDRQRAQTWLVLCENARKR